MKGSRSLITTVLTLLISTASFAQKTGPVIFTVDNDTVWGGEFERVYSKNNDVKTKKPTIEELEDYRDLYIKFKLKVKEAYALQMDTNRAYLGELAGYRKQLAQPYLTDKKVTEKLVQEAYKRWKTEVRASNLMIHVDESASPADTLKAYNRIMKWREMLVDGDVDFAQLAHDSSTDESAKINYGDLGYFTVFNMIYDFENMAYNTPVGGISPVFRTQFGYHILKVTDKRPNRGERKVAHILIRVNSDSEAEEKKKQIDAVYEAYKSGTPWDELVDRYTQDFTSRARGGELNWFGSVNAGDGIPPSFREAAFAIDSIGEVTQPIRTEAGWHLMKLIGERGIKPLDEMRETLKFKIARDQRGELNEEAVLNRIMTENVFIQHPKAINAFLESLTDDVRFKRWKPDDFHNTDTVLFTIGDKKYTYHQFANYLYVKQPYKASGTPEMVGREIYNEWVKERNLAREEELLEDKYPDFRYLMQEYRDGILLFELTSKMVWEKATEDTAGLNKFFEANRENYRWDKRADITQYSCANKKVAKKVKRLIRRGKGDKFIQEKLNKKNALAVQVTMDRIEWGVDTAYDSMTWEEGIHPFDDGTKNIVLVKVSKVIAPGLKELSEVKGPVTSDYQEYLEDQWIAELKKKYKVQINEGALEELFK